MKCAATTKAGKPCPIDARPSGFCHVHDPAVQCGVTTRKGKRCMVATGGGRCDAHREKELESSQTELWPAAYRENESTGERPGPRMVLDPVLGLVSLDER